jgi:hypothetical protein
MGLFTSKMVVPILLFCGLSYGQTIAGPVTLGPITLGKPWPALPVCQKATPATSYVPSGQGICRDGQSSEFVWNVPYDGANLDVWLLDRCKKEEATCPIGEVFSSVSERMCNDVVDTLRAKFGKPEIKSFPVQNAAGARWIRTEYLWLRKNGDSLAFILHREMSDCEMLAQTAERRAEQKKPEVKF